MPIYQFCFSNSDMAYYLHGIGMSLSRIYPVYLWTLPPMATTHSRRPDDLKNEVTAPTAHIHVTHVYIWSGTVLKGLPSKCIQITNLYLPHGAAVLLTAPSLFLIKGFRTQHSFHCTPDCHNLPYIHLSILGDCSTSLLWFLKANKVAS